MNIVLDSDETNAEFLNEVIEEDSEIQKKVNHLKVQNELDNSKRRYKNGEYLDGIKARERLLAKYCDG